MDDNVDAFLGRNLAGRLWSRFYLGYSYIPFFDYHIANSSYTADELREAMRARHERPVYVRPMGVEVDDFAGALRSDKSRRSLIAEAGGDERTKLLLYAGRLSPEKNLKLLIEMIERLEDDFRLIVAGDGPLAALFENEAEIRAPGRVHLLGHIGDREKLLRLYADCDAFVHPNPREPFGIAPLEAMALDVPVIVSRQSGVAEILQHALKVDFWDVRDMAEKILAVIRRPALRKTLVESGREEVAQMSWDLRGQHLHDLYRELVS
jgi:glycosyltransferase involved in cell wall biosynthesis